MAIIIIFSKSFNIHAIQKKNSSMFSTDMNLVLLRLDWNDALTATTC